MATYSLFNLVLDLNRDHTWITHLNHNYNLTKKQFDLELTDLYNVSDYSDQYFCSVKDFPHYNYVFPIINSKPDLDCSCTLLYLLKEKKSYRGVRINGLETVSTAKCLNDPNFEQMVSNCGFKELIQACNNQLTTTLPTTLTSKITTTSTTTTTPTTTTTTSSYDPSIEIDKLNNLISQYKATMIVFIVLFLVSLLVSGVLIFIFPEWLNRLRLNLRPRSQTTESISFQPMGEDKLW